MWGVRVWVGLGYGWGGFGGVAGMMVGCRCGPHILWGRNGMGWGLGRVWVWVVVGIGTGVEEWDGMGWGLGRVWVWVVVGMWKGG